MTDDEKRHLKNRMFDTLILCPIAVPGAVYSLSKLFHAASMSAPQIAFWGFIALCGVGVTAQAAYAAYQYLTKGLRHPRAEDNNPFVIVGPSIHRDLK